MTDTQSHSPLSGNVLFYSQPEPLNREQHGALGIKALDRPFAFAAGAHIVPLTVTEFAPCSLSYPIIFAGENRQPLAVMGVQAGENLSISPDGIVDFDAYLPAYIRRYPFVLADDSAQKRLIVCIDRAAPMIAEGGEAPLFDGDQATDFTNRAIEFCNSFEQERLRTVQFVDLIRSLELLEVRQATYTPRMEDGTLGQPQQIAEYYAVSEESLNKLPEAKLRELRDNGALGQIYAHMVSLLGWDRLYARALRRRATEAPASGSASLN